MDTILVADDDSGVRSSLGVALRGEGYHVEFVKNGDEVLKRVESRNLDVALILLDVRMLRYFALQQLQSNDRLQLNHRKFDCLLHLL